MYASDVTAEEIKFVDYQEHVMFIFISDNGIKSKVTKFKLAIDRSKLVFIIAQIVLYSYLFRYLYKILISNDVL
jgi:hypothetical protein